MGTFGFAAACAGNNLNSRETIVDGTAHHRARMGNTFLRYCHFLTPDTEWIVKANMGFDFTFRRMILSSRNPHH